jgi:hypothetical protein
VTRCELTIHSTLVLASLALGVIALAATVGAWICAHGVSAVVTSVITASVDFQSLGCRCRTRRNGKHPGERSVGRLAMHRSAHSLTALSYLDGNFRYRRVCGSIQFRLVWWILPLDHIAHFALSCNSTVLATPNSLKMLLRKKKIVMMEDIWT